MDKERKYNMATFTQEVKPDSNMMIVDCMNVAFRWKHSGASKFVEEYVATVMSLAKSYNAGTIIAAADWGGSSYRKTLFPAYKANRKELVEKQTAEEKEASRKFFDEYERVLEALDKHPRIQLFRYQGVEADDIAAYLVSRLHDYGFDQAWLISSDRDWDLLVGPNVSRFSTVTRKEVTLDTWDYPVTPEQYISYKVLVGDTGDNIPGIPGVGPKRAAALIEQYGSAMDIYDACPLAGKQKFIQAVNDNRDQIPLNYELMDLISFSQEAIGHNNVQDIGRRLVFGAK
jgi:DNA polymerase-1